MTWPVTRGQLRKPALGITNSHGPVSEQGPRLTRKAWRLDRRTVRPIVEMAEVNPATLGIAQTLGRLSNLPLERQEHPI